MSAEKNEAASGGLVQVARLLLVLALAGGIVWSVQATRAGLRWRAGERLLASGHYGAAVSALEDAVNTAPPGGGPGYDSARAHLALSYAYLARRDLRAAAVLPARAGEPGLGAAVAVQQAVIAAAAGDQAHALADLDRALQQAGPEAGGVESSALWHRAELLRATGDPAADADLAALVGRAGHHNPYRVAALLRQAERSLGDDPVAAGRALAAARAALPVDSAGAARPDLHLPDLHLDEGLAPAVVSDTIPRLEAALRGAAALGTAGRPTRDLYWGHALVAVEAWPEAAALLRRALAGDRQLADVYAYLGLTQERTDNPREAEVNYRTAIRLAPERDLGPHLLARLLLAANRGDEAKSLLDTVLAHDPSSVLAHADRAVWAEQQHDYNAAEADLQAAEQQQIAREASGSAGPDERALNVPLLLAEFYFRTGLAERGCTPARDAATRAVARQAGAPELDALGWADHLCGDDAAARQALTAAVAAEPRLPAAQYHLGLLLQGVDPAGARTALEAAQDLDPGGLWDRRALAALTHGE